MQHGNRLKLNTLINSNNLQVIVVFNSWLIENSTILKYISIEQIEETCSLEKSIKKRLP